jgi:hypothetical protein
MKPQLIRAACIHCGCMNSRDWSSILPGAVVCDECPLYKYEPDPVWKYPDLVNETQIEPGIFVRTCAFERMTKYGYCYLTFAVAVRSSQMKEVRRYKTREEAEASHQECVTFVIARRAERRRAHGSSQSARARR